MNNTEIKTHTINIKGDIQKTFHDMSLNRKYQDVTYGYGQIIFVGTDQERDEYALWLVENEGKFGFKII